MKYNLDSFIKIFKYICFAAFITLCASLFYYQIVKGNYYLRRARNNYVRIIPERSIRGKIFDRNGFAIAYDKASFNIGVIPYQIRNKKETVFQELSQYSGLSIKILNRNYNREFQNLFTPVDVIIDIDKDKAFQIKEKLQDDVLIDPQPQRFYSYPYEFAHITGYVKEASAFYDRLKKYGYEPAERIGLSGIEQYYDAYLRGEDGGDLVEVNSRGKIAGFLGKLNPQRGKDIQLSVDAQIQKLAYETIEGKKGALILMDSNNGEILALVSFPSFDPNSFVKGKSEVTRFLNDKNRPMQNRATQSTFPLGSTFKPIVAIAGLEEKKLSPPTTYTCKGKFYIGKAEFKCEHIHGEQNLYEAIAHSCNVYFYNVGLILGREIMTRWAEKLGLSSLTNIDLPYEKKGSVPIAGLRFKNRWYTGDTVNLSIGQGYIACSPMEIMLAINTFATNGRLVRPHLIKTIDNTEVINSYGNKLNISPQNIRVVKEGLQQVVEDETGTARILKPLNLKIAGKTGTAQTNNKAHGWFVGFFPYDNPKYTICVFLENAGSSYEALRIVDSFLKKLKENKIL